VSECRRDRLLSGQWLLGRGKRRTQRESRGEECSKAHP
jgi:hypothetical protein